jgi:hypothetical protein
MKVVVLSYGDEILGVYSSIEMANYAEEFYSKSEHFIRHEHGVFFREEFELDDCSDKRFKEENNPTVDSSFLEKTREIINGSLIIVILLIILTTIVLGIKSCGQIMLNFFK